MFNYPKIETISINDKRYYQIDNDTFYPSITTILGNTIPKEKKFALEEWIHRLGVEKANLETKRAADRGTIVHKLIEQFLKKESLDCPEATPVEMKIFNALKLFLKPINKIYGQEVALFSNVLKVAGRCDFIGEYNDLPVVADWKTSTNAKDEGRVKDYITQATFYALAHNEMFGTELERIMIFIGVENGLPQIFQYMITTDMITELANRTETFYREFG